MTRPLVLAALLVALLLPPVHAAGVEDICPLRGTRCADYALVANYVDMILLPIPDGNPGPLRQPAGGWTQFGRQQPETPVWNPPGQKWVGLQAGHWKFDEAPEELISLRRNPGAPGGGRAEWQVALEIAERAAELLRASGVAVDILPTTIPIRYRAHAFMSIHLDGDETGRLRGYKLARPNFSSIPDVDDRFAAMTFEEYGKATGLPDNSELITGRMRNYYAFNARRYQHAVAPGVPQVILESAFMSNAADRALVFNRPDIPARGVYESMMRFLAADLH